MFLMSVLIFWLLLQHGREQQKSLLESYALTLNQVNTEQLAILISGKNLIALQAKINQLSQQDRVLEAVIYNVDNQILVQSGRSQTSTAEYKEYSHAITLDQNLLGTLNITLDTQLQSPSYFGLLIFLLCGGFCLLIFSLWQARIVGINHSAAKPQKADIIEESKENPRQSGKADNPCHRILAMIKLGAMNTLFEQLNAQSRNQQLELLEDALVKVVKLYSGEIVAIDKDSALLDFKSNSLTDACFQAVCCAHLLQQTAVRQKWFLQPQVTISSAKASSDIAGRLIQSHRIHNNQEQQPILLIERDIVKNSELEKRVDFGVQGEAEEIFVSFKAFHKGYHQLLENQLDRVLLAKNI